MKYLNLSTFEFSLNIVNLYYVYQDSLNNMCNMAIWRRKDTPIRKVLHPTNEHEYLTDDDSNMMPLWFHGDCMPKVLIDNDDLSNKEKSYNDYEEDFVINAK